MNISELQRAINSGENEKIEFKQNFNDNVIETLVAFANTNGGKILIGVTDKGIIKGVQIGKETIPGWLNEIKNKTQPAIVPSIDLINVNEQTIVVIETNEFPIKPLAFKGRYYKRVNSSNHLLTPNEITDLNMRSLQVSWDSYYSPNKSINDLDDVKITKFIQKVNLTGRFNLSTDWKYNLEKLKLISGEKITNAAWLLFGKENIGYNIHLGRFKTSSLILDDKMLNCSLFDAVEDTMNYIIGHLKIAFEIKGHPTQRTELFEYPLPALREIVLNAIIHRDYTSPIDVQIKIFDQQITFFNPGLLYGNLTVSQLEQDNYQANTRNKLIAEAFYLTGDIEKYGSGFIRIRNEIKSYPTMQFNFEELANGFLTALKYINQKITNDVTNDVTDDVTDDVTGDVTGDVTDDRLEKILDLIKKNPQIKVDEIAVNLQLSKRTILRDIKKLRDLNQIEYHGTSRKGHWKMK